jgi:hypothetical protein
MFRIGFYYVTYNIGFRDHFDPSTDQIIKCVSEVEARADPENATRLIARIKWFASRTTHMCVYRTYPRAVGADSLYFSLTAFPTTSCPVGLRATSLLSFKI